MEQSIEGRGNNIEKSTALKSIIELAKNAGLSEIVRTAEQELDTIEKHEADNEQLKNIISETETSATAEAPMVKESEEEVSEKISTLKEEIHNSFDNKHENTQEAVNEVIPYQEYDKQFMYFDSGEGTSFMKSNDSAENLFSYDEKTGNVLPRKEAWEYAKSNMSYFVNKYFENEAYGEKLKIPLDQLKFVPAKVNEKGVIIEKGKIITP
jgi:hypothetical protein